MAKFLFKIKSHVHLTVRPTEAFRAKKSFAQKNQLVRFDENYRVGMICALPGGLAREGRVDYLLVESTGIAEPLPAAERRLGRRTALTLPLLPPPQKN